MSKVKIKLELQGLKLEIEAERENIPSITRGITEQLAGIFRAPGSVLGVEPEQLPNRTIQLAAADETKNAKIPKRRRTSSTAESAGTAIDFRHDVAKYGNPKQEWNTAQKALWLIYVVSKQTEHKELSQGSIADTFNKHFKQAKLIQQGNVGRDLGKLKILASAPVGEDTTKSPSVWYLTDESEKYIQKLIGAKTEITSTPA